MSRIGDYLDILEHRHLMQLRTAKFISEIEMFCQKNRHKLESLPSAGQLEQLKLLRDKPDELIGYIISQSKKTLNTKWRTKVLSDDEERLFFEFIIDRIFSLGRTIAKEADFRTMVSYFIEYLVDIVRMKRK